MKQKRQMNRKSMSTILLATIGIASFLTVEAIAQPTINRTSQDHIINSSINSYVPANSTASLGFVYVPRASRHDVDLVIIAEGEGRFDPIIEAYFTSSPGNIIVRNDDFQASSPNDYPDTSATRRTRSCLVNYFRPRLESADSLILISSDIAGSSVAKGMVVNVSNYNRSGGRVNLQLLQLDGPLNGFCGNF